MATQEKKDVFRGVKNVFWFGHDAVSALIGLALFGTALAAGYGIADDLVDWNTHFSMFGEDIDFSGISSVAVNGVAGLVLAMFALKARNKIRWGYFDL